MTKNQKVQEKIGKALKRRKIPKLNNNFKGINRHLMTINWDRKCINKMKFFKKGVMNKKKY